MFAHAPNKSLQRTFDPPPTFAIAKAVVASNAAELRRYIPKPMNHRELLKCPKCQEPIGHNTKITFFSALGSGFAAELILWMIVGVLGVVVSSLGFGPVFAVALLLSGGAFAFLLSRSKSFICQYCSEKINARIVQKYNKSLNADADKAGGG